MQRHMNESLVRRRPNTSTALPSRSTIRVFVIACALAVLAFPAGRQVQGIESLLRQPRVAQAQDVSTQPIPGLAAHGRIAFDGDREGADLWDEIYVMNLDGSGERRVTPTTHSCHAQSPRWSPNGHQIAFHCLVDNDSVPPVTVAEDIFIINDDGTGLTQITQFGSVLAGFASWSPDGRRIAFVGNQCNMCARHIYI